MIEMKETLTIIHTPQFFQPMLLNSKFLHKKVHFKWSFFLSDKEKNKSQNGHATPLDNSFNVVVQVKGFRL